MDISWNNLKEVYDHFGTIDKTAEALGCGRKKVMREIHRRGIPVHPRGKPKGYKWTEEQREKDRLHRRDAAHRQADRERLLKRLPSMDGSVNSPLERLLHEALQRAGISFETQCLKLGKYLVDIELTAKPVIIEADGAMHNLRRERERDPIRDAELREAGYEVYRFSGKTIHALGPDECVRQVIEGSGIAAPEVAPVANIRLHPTGADNPAWKGGMHEYSCNWCGATFYRHRAHRVCKNIYCSHKCYGEWRRAHPEQNPVLVRWERKRAGEIVT